ncbi:DUF2690 domain-containing protein [Streptomyces sp. NPDC060209]|uniref:helix-turn-helix domain-containing protein n=1 Tax=Streptomyces sp. NPDC060209 TaxID=3347073 RepID=UPI0036488538
MTTEHGRLLEALRELRAGAGLSLAALAERTPYSKSSWERYLNGKSLLPRQAVRELCRLANEPDGRLLALWEIAESHWRGRAAAPPSTPPAEEPTPPTPPESPPPVETGLRRFGRSRLLVVLASVYTMMIGGVAILLFLQLPDSEAQEAEQRDAVPFSIAPQCHGAACEGRDPMRLICGIDPDTLASHRTATGAHIELRHSRKCGATWARTWGTEIGDRVDVTAGGPTHSVRIRTKDDAATFVYTEMTEARPGSTVRACFRPATADGEPECVDARVGWGTTAVRRISP